MRVRERYVLPEEKQKLIDKARRYEYWTIFFLITITVLMYFTMGSSQAMKTAWIEDVLSLIPPIAFLIAAKVREKEPNERFPYGFHRAMMLSFLAAAFALFVLGAYMVYDSSMGLIRMEHPTISHREIMGFRTWSGWLMIAALIYSALPPVILGRLKQPIARELHDKTLFADADMNKADWMTALAAVGGIIGIGFGLWWADSVAALFISIDVVRDGIRNVKGVMFDLLQQHPTNVEKTKPLPLPEILVDLLRDLDWVEDADVRLYEDGMLISGEAWLIARDGEVSTERLREASELVHGADWKLHDVTVTFVDDLDVRIVGYGDDPNR